MALAVHRADGRFAPALRSVLIQEGVGLDVVIVLNGSDGATRALVEREVNGDPRGRVLELERPNLAAALNVALREARFPLVARMDADDESLPGRLAMQTRAMMERQDLLALGTGFEVVDEQGVCMRVLRSPVDPADARWRLLIENEFCHGSMMLRRDGVLALGGYDESFERAQDFELWRRLARGLAIAAIPDVLYRWRQRRGGAYASGPEQARRAAELLTSGWADLPAGDFGGDSAGIAAALDDLLAGRTHVRGFRDAVEASLRQEPTRAALEAWLWSWRVYPDMAYRALASMRRAALERALHGVDPSQHVRALGVDERSRWVLDAARDVSRTLEPVDRQTADALRAGDVLLLASDWTQDQDWEATAGLRERGVRVVRLY